MGGLKVYSKEPLFTGKTKTDTFYFLYFLLHIPITVLIDSALAIPKEYQLNVQKSLLEFHIGQNKDFLLANPPYWLTVFGWIELVLQLPFFFIGAAALFKRTTKVYPYMVVYGLEASITTVCCLVTIWVEGEANGLNYGDIISLIGVYLPTFIIPFYMACEVLSRNWGTSKEAGLKKTS